MKKVTQLKPKPLTDEQLTVMVNLAEQGFMTHHYMARLAEEVRRLRRGEFTEEEFQTLCHSLPAADPECPLRFANGCREYNKKLFGDKSCL